MAFTPVPTLVSQVTAGGTPVTAVPANPDGGVITNPLTATQPLYVDPINPAGTSASGTTFALAPGQSWTIIPGQTTSTSVNSVDSAHVFSGIYY